MNALADIYHTLFPGDLSLLRTKSDKRSDAHAPASQPPSPRTCANRPRVIPPAARLVCVETNPGPPMRAGRGGARRNATTSIAEGVVAMINAGGIPPSKLKPQGKRRVPRAPRPAPSRIGKVVQNYNPAMSMRSTSVRAPVSSGAILRAANPVHRVRLPFSTIGPRVTTDSDGSIVFVHRTLGARVLQLDPNDAQIFPEAVTVIASQFRHYKMVRFTATYHPIVPTSTLGAIALAYLNDGGVIGGGLVTFDEVGGIDGATTGPIWSTFDLRFPNLDKNDKFTRDPAVETTAERRMDHFGCIVGSHFGLTSSASWGYLTFDGEIEFYGLASSTVTPPMGRPLLPAAASAQPATSSSSPSHTFISVEECKMCECKPMV